MKEWWDFDENKNYVIVNYKNKKYKVLNLPNKELVAKRLYDIENFINVISQLIYKNLSKIPISLKNNCIVFLSIHPDYYYLQEMQLNTSFLGLNKPKNVQFNKYLPSVGKDKFLKAEYRGIFLQIRNSNGKVKNMSELLPLVIHEISHTGCNHVRWRDNDHGRDFQDFENLIYNLITEK